MRHTETDVRNIKTIVNSVLLKVASYIILFGILSELYRIPAGVRVCTKLMVIPDGGQLWALRISKQWKSLLA